MTALRLTPRLRWTVLLAFVGAAALFVYAGVNSTGPARVAWLLGAVVLLGISYAVTATPAPSAEPCDPPVGRRAIDPLERAARPQPTFAVPIAFTGDVTDVFAYLQHGEHVFGGHGRCDAIDHDAHVTVEVEAGDPAEARQRGRALVDQAGGLVVHVAEAQWVG